MKKIWMIQTWKVWTIQTWKNTWLPNKWQLHEVVALELEAVVLHEAEEPQAMLHLVQKIVMMRRMTVMKMAMKNILQNPQAEVVELELEGVVLEVVEEVQVMLGLVAVKVTTILLETARYQQLLEGGVGDEAEAVEQPITSNPKSMTVSRMTIDLRKICSLKPHEERLGVQLKPEEEAGVEVGEEELPQPVVRQILPLLNQARKKKLVGTRTKMTRKTRLRHADPVEQVAGLLLTALKKWKKGRRKKKRP